MNNEYEEKIAKGYSTMAREVEKFSTDMNKVVHCLETIRNRSMPLDLIHKELSDLRNIIEDGLSKLDRGMANLQKYMDTRHLQSQQIQTSLNQWSLVLLRARATSDGIAHMLEHYNVFYMTFDHLVNNVKRQ